MASGGASGLELGLCTCPADGGTLTLWLRAAQNCSFQRAGRGSHWPRPLAAPDGPGMPPGLRPRQPLRAVQDTREHRSGGKAQCVVSPDGRLLPTGVTGGGQVPSLGEWILGDHLGHMPLLPCKAYDCGRPREPCALCRV